MKNILMLMVLLVIVTTSVANAYDYSDLEDNTYVESIRKQKYLIIDNIIILNPATADEVLFDVKDILFIKKDYIWLKSDGNRIALPTKEAHKEVVKRYIRYRK